MEDKEGTTEVLNELGITFYTEGDFTSAKLYFESSLKAGKESNNPTHFFLAELNLAKAYEKLNLKEKARGIARHYLNEAIKRKKNESASNAYGFLSDLALERKNLPLAKEFLDKSISCLGQTDNLFFKAQALTNLGAYFAASGEYNQALDYFQKALELRIKTNHRKGIIESYYNLGSLAYMKNNYLEAEELFLQGMKKAESEGFSSDQIDFLELLVEIQKELKNKDKEIEYYRQFLDQKDKNQEILLKNQEENERLVDSFSIQNSNERITSSPSYFWTGILVGAGSIFSLIFLLNYFFGRTKFSNFSNRYDK
jgi:tetratricopeptide (TPR) repeat protein